MSETNPAVNVIFTNNTKKQWSRQSILSWCNKLLNTNITKLNDLCTGAAYCGLFDILYPDVINLSRVKFVTNQENDYINNFVLLQQGLTKIKINKQIPINKLVLGKFQDNYEFAAWFRLFFETNFKTMPIGYDVMAKRRNVPILLGQVTTIKRSKTTLSKDYRPKKRACSQEPKILPCRTDTIASDSENNKAPRVPVVCRQRNEYNRYLAEYMGLKTPYLDI